MQIEMHARETCSRECCEGWVCVSTTSAISYRMQVVVQGVLRRGGVFSYRFSDQLQHRMRNIPKKKSWVGEPPPRIAERGVGGGGRRRVDRSSSSAAYPGRTFPNWRTKLDWVVSSE